MLEIRKISRGYQITLPKFFRERYDLHEGDIIEAIEKDGELVLRPLKRSENIAQKLLKTLETLEESPNFASLDEDSLVEAVRIETKAQRTQADNPPRKTNT